MSDVNQRIATKAVIVKDQKVLVLREASTYEEGTNQGRYHFPGGRLEPGEPFEQGLRREVTEETGLEIIIKEPLYVGEWFPEIKGVKNQIVAVFFVCEPLSATITLSDEHDAYEWIDLENIGNFDLMPPDDDVVKTYFQKYA